MKVLSRQATTGPMLFLGLVALLWGMASAASSSTSFQDFKALCDGQAPPAYLKGVNFEPLLTPPTGFGSWTSWVHQSTKTIMDYRDSVDAFDATPQAVFPVDASQPDGYGFRVDVKYLHSEAQLQHALDAQDSVVNLVFVDEMPGLAEKLEALGDTIERKPEDADFYIAQPAAGSYGWHMDHVDNLVYCVEGSKRFRVAGKELGSPVVVDVMMEPGDAIFVPAGYYHHGAGGQDDVSVIWSIGFKTMQWANKDEEYNPKKEKDRIRFATGKMWEYFAPDKVHARNQKVLELCQESPVEARLVRGLHLEALDVPPVNDERTWMGWLDEYAEEIMEDGGRSQLIMPRPDQHGIVLPSMFGWHVNILDLDDDEDLYNALDKTNSMTHLASIHHMPDIADKMAELAKSTARSVGPADLYVAQTAAPSLGWHFKEYDTMIASVFGAVHVQVAGEEFGSKVSMDVKLEAGDALYIPAGLYHSFETGSDASVSMFWRIGFSSVESESEDHWNHKKLTDMQRVREALSWENIAVVGSEL